MTAAAAPSTRRNLLVDTGIVAGFVAVGQLALHVDDGSGLHGTAPAVPTAILVAAIPLPLLWRRRWPFGLLVAVALVIVVPHAFASITLPQLGGFGVIVFALYSASHWAVRPKDLLALLVPVVAIAALALEVPDLSQPDLYTFSFPVLLLAWLVGQVMRRYSRLTLRLRGALDELAATEQVRAEAAVADERTRIARELHDVVAHAVSVMVVQAGSARLALAEHPEASAAAARTVEETGRQALVEMRHMLGLLRAVEVMPSLEPQPTLRGVTALVDAARDAGRPVELHVEGVPVALAAGLDLSAFRIVQEALTNAFRHAGPVPVEVWIRYGRDELTLEITNAPPAAPAARPSRRDGHGLIGMRERTELFGGRLEAGRRADGGFTVRAVLPLPEPAGGRLGEAVA